MALLYIGLGSNLGDKTSNLEQAIHHIARQIGPIKSRSVFLCSEPWGYASDNSFVNAVICVESSANPHEVITLLKSIEKAMGRPQKTSEGYQDRIIDLDILLFGDLIIRDAQLTIPHPFLHQRSFVLVPLAEIATDFVHPVMNKTIGELLTAFNEQS